MSDMQILSRPGTDFTTSFDLVVTRFKIFDECLKRIRHGSEWLLNSQYRNPSTTFSFSSRIH